MPFKARGAAILTNFSLEVKQKKKQMIIFYSTVQIGIGFKKRMRPRTGPKKKPTCT